MRYSVFFKKPGGIKTCVYNTMSPDPSLALIKPKLHLAADSAGTLECSLNPNSHGISDDVLERMATKVMVTENKDINGLDKKIIFYGRVLSIEEDFYKTPSLYCEGAYSFFNDTVIMPGKNLSWNSAEERYRTPKEALIELLGEHNLAVTKGNSEQGLLFSTNPNDMIVTMSDGIFSAKANDGTDKTIEHFTVDTYTSTLDVLSDLRSTFGGHFRVRYRFPNLDDPNEQNLTQMAIPILDWIEDMDKKDENGKPETPVSYISFGTNLLDFTKKRDGVNIVNALFLTGKKISSKGSTVIGDEIDIAPMCLYWKLDKNNQPYNPRTLSGTYNTWDPEHYPLHDPSTVNDLYVDGNPIDIDISHVYHIGNGWYVWNPTLNSNQGGYQDISISREATDDDFMNNDVIRHHGYVGGDDPGHLWPSNWTASSSGLATGFGIRLVKDQVDQIKFVAESSYISTGYWNSIDCGYNVSPVDQLNVFEETKLYQTANGYEDSILRIFATGTIRGYAGDATILSSSAASKGGTKYELSQFTVPTPTQEELKPLQIHLNVSGRHSWVRNDDWNPPTRAAMELNLYNSRITSYDEYVTLWGLADGSHQNFTTQIETEKENGQKVNETILVTAKPVKQNMPGTDPSSTDKYFIYPEPAPDKTVAYFQNEEEIRQQTGDLNTYYVALDTCDVHVWDGTNFVNKMDHRAYVVNSYMVEDPVAIAKYGRIEKIVNFDHCLDPESLKLLGAKSLFESKLESFEINVSAFDLTLLDSNIDSPDVLDPIRIVSYPHMIDTILPLGERDIQLNDPSDQQYSIGYQGTQKISKTNSWIKK